MRSVIEIKNLSYKYPNSSISVLNNINLEISRGEFILIAGRTGSGKSSLCKAIVGLIPNFYKGDFAGEVKVLGESTLRQKIAGKIGMIFQNPEDQILTMQVESEIAFGLENLGLPRAEIAQRVEEAISQLQIEYLRERSPYEISSGELQKVAIASILAMKPEVLILDEPTSDLDPQSAINLFKILTSLHNQGKTIILVEHRLDQVLAIVNKVAILEQGKILALGSPREVIRNFELEKIGIRIPRICKLAKQLGMEKIPLSVEEFIEEWRHLCKLN
ncbi:MAG: ABC transporter ATP-binding protein [Halobacteria archaeon]